MNYYVHKCLNLIDNLNIGCMMKPLIGKIAAVVAFLISSYVLLGIVELVPLLSYEVMGESLLRFSTQVAVVFFLVAAWAYWEI